MSLEAFQKRMGVPLMKATAPEDFAAIRKETDTSGVDVVDHIPDLHAHPSEMQAKVEEYRNGLANHTPMIRTTPHTLHGKTAKAVYKIHSANNLPEGKVVLVKPYHEKLHHKIKFWQKHPIMGWAEMTNQALWHAAGMGGSHQQVHVSEHDMGPGFEKHPALVIHMDPKSDYIEKMDPSEYTPSMGNEAVKIGVMDFLSNNLDRHARNLLVRPEGSVDERGMPQNRLVGIDHGRSFQYHAAHKGIPSFYDDPFLGRMPIDQAVRDEKNAEGKALDNLSFYMQSNALEKLSDAARGNGFGRISNPFRYIRHIANWWPGVRDRVVQAFGDRVGGIKESRMKQHLLDNFHERVKKLDDISARPEWYLHEAKTSDLDIPLKVWDR